ncbi:enolase [Methanothermus fervidus DSM 2088]|uniref:Enolase n=1 Tax=Methanothermus fervidus (strain ATCC 43054 / DSM 2088 / JCM 10308 / V24 S) TaxID=523846 RepID=E3GZF8_METFV|nr:phosphopyruvate hydratase [Methanothermus fervidus]ADP77690.1 enolase [Methanothermus fervidus DSM 2088]
MNSIIEDIRVRKIIDSRGNPTIEVDVLTVSGFGRAAAPSGASTGVKEVKAFPEGDIDKIISDIEDILSSELIGMDAEDSREIDAVLKEIDGTKDLSSLGGNTIVAVSMATAKAAASSYGLPLYKFLGGNFSFRLPYPLGNMINGGVHAGKRTPDIQEFLALPKGASTFKEAVLTNSKVHKRIRELIDKKDKTFTGGKGDEGGWTPNITSMDALEILSEACENVSDETGVEVSCGLDFAASELWDHERKKYIYERDVLENDPGEQIDFVIDVIKSFNLYYVEDPFHENDFESFAELTKKVGDKCIICGDDLFVTNKKYLAKGIKYGAANAIIIKPNQVGTLTDTYDTLTLAKENQYIPVMSHRSGETTDETIAHLAVAFSCPIIKTGAIGGERIAKLNELIRIEEEIIDSSMAELER